MLSNNEGIQMKPSNVTLTLEDRVEDVVVQEEKISSKNLTSETQKKIQRQQESHCSLTRMDTYSKSLPIEVG